jgi:hypothetical protein
MPGPSVSTHPPRRSAARRSAPIVLAICAGSLLLASAASAANFTWSGGGGADDWSDGANWLGGVAPSSGASIGTLRFPELSSPVHSDNDLAGVSVEQVQLDNTHGFGLGGNGFSLGSGGVTLSAAAVPPIFSTVLAAPIVLTADQTWTVSGPIEPGPPDDIGLTGQLSGESANLTINLNTYADLAFGSFIEASGPDDEIGNTTITGSDAREKLGEDEVIHKSMVNLPVGFNGSDGKRLRVKDVELFGSGPTGPIVAEDASVGLEGAAIGPVTGLDGSGLGINGSVAAVTLDASSGLSFQILPAGSTPGTDYERLTSTGPITLGGGRLSIATAQDEAHECPPPPIGQVYPLISTTGSIVGSFSNAPDGSTVVTDECLVANYEHPEHPEVLAQRWYLYRINYQTGSSPETVTATALPAVPTMLPEEAQLPVIVGTPTEGQVLSETHGSWTNSPTSYSYQWQRCDSGGSNCLSITGATASSCSLTSADVGATIRVQETASNSEGSSQPAISTATAVVQAASSGGSSGGGLVNDGGISTVTNPGVTPATVSSAQIMALLRRQLVPSSKAVTIGSLLKHGGLSLSVQALEAGTLTMQWSYLPKGAKTAKATPVLVAAGKLTFSGAGTGKLTLRLTAAGRQLLRHAKRVILSARGTFTSQSAPPLSSSAGLVLRR